ASIPAHRLPATGTAACQQKGYEGEQQRVERAMRQGEALPLVAPTLRATYMHWCLPSACPLQPQPAPVPQAVQVERSPARTSRALLPPPSLPRHIFTLRQMTTTLTTKETKARTAWAGSQPAASTGRRKA